MAGTEKVNGTFTGNISKVDSVAVANIASINGVPWQISTDGFQYNGVTDYSCMFNKASGTRLVDTLDENSDSYQIGTVSLWVKRTLLSMGSYKTLWYGGDSSLLGNMLDIQFHTDDTLRVLTDGAGATYLRTNAKFRDCSGWYHIVSALDTSQAAPADRSKLYVNGVRITDFSVEVYPAQHANMQWYNTDLQIIGNLQANATYALDGYLAEVNWIDNQQLTPTDFGELKEGIWIPKTYAGAYGTNGKHLEFTDDTNFGLDVSGNTDDFTVEDMAADHQVIDTPENNHCTWDANNGYVLTTSLAEGGLNYKYAAAAYTTCLGTFLMKTGKWYWEVDCNGDGDEIGTGIVASGESSGDVIPAAFYAGVTAQSYAIFNDTSAGQFYIVNNADGGVADDNLAVPDANDILMVAFDADTGKIWFGADGTWGDFGVTGVGNPADGINPAYTADDPALYDYLPAISVYANLLSIANFGQRTFAHTPPTGFKSLCSKNMSEPTIMEPTKELFSTVIYEGTGAENIITGVGFSPDLVWVKNRDAGDAHNLVDTVRGATKEWNINANNVETTVAEGVKSFDEDGFTLGTDNTYNTNGENFVAWCFKEGAASGFDIVAYEGTGIAHDIAHDLGVVPQFIMVKRLDIESSNANAYHFAALNKTDPETDYGIPAGGNAWQNDGTRWNNTAPTATDFTVGTAVKTNADNTQYIAYLFTSIPGATRLFHYVGNGNVTGPYIPLGFRPAYVTIKSVNVQGDWVCLDDVRTINNQMDDYLKWNGANVEDTTGENEMDFLANGIKLRCIDTAVNQNNVDYIGLAFARQPFKYSNAR